MRVQESHEVVGKFSIKVESGKLASIGAIVSSTVTYHTKQLNTQPTSPASHVVTGCLPVKKRANYFGHTLT